MDFLKKNVLFICLLAVAWFFLADPSLTLAATELKTDIVANDAGGFNTNMRNSLQMAHNVAVTISTIMICLGGMMVTMNLEGPNKLLWNSVLGIGLALGFASFLGVAFNDQIAGMDDIPGYFAGVVYHSAVHHASAVPHRHRAPDGAV